MAEEEKTEQEGSKPDGEVKSKSVIARLLPWVILLLISAASAAGGFGLSCILAAPDSGDNSAADAQKEETSQNVKEDAENKKPWYYTLEPVVANLDEPGAARYVRAVLTLEMSPKLKETEGRKLLEEKNPIIVDWLHVYLMSLTLDDVTGKNSISRIQAQILDSLNQMLWPDAKPQIKRVLLKEFPIQ